MLPISYDNIRASLGVSTDELEDATLALPLYEQKLRIELEDIDGDLYSKYEEVLDLPSPSRAETRFINVFELYSTYAVANHLLTSVSLFAPKVIEDGSAKVERIVDPFADTRNAVAQTLALMRGRLITAYTAVSGITPAYTSYVRPTFTLSTGLAVDPVTGS
jgi:hypothetical protein